ncbi:hypothetical protein UPYG_G00061410 [Umbra pygmaea]|uniref:Ig-like domain-containing protein n=1 Tax=Umbra pygmaea TaxID=75934 RepID=A0ABD0XCT4_UMBPY
MSLRTTGSVLVVFLWSVTVVLGQNGWGVTYTTQRIYVLKQSTVNLSCSYMYPSGHIVTSTFWFIEWQYGAAEPNDLSQDPRYAGRVTYYSDKNGHTLAITDLRNTDSAEYKFRFITDHNGGRYSGHPGVTLSFTDFLLEMDPTSVSEGGKVTLLCRTTCTLDHNPEYIWYKNEKSVNNPVTSFNKLILDPVNSVDAGRYSCAVRGCNDLRSPENTLTVRYGPRKPSVLLSPSGEIVEGSSVTLTCSSDANPPVNNYIWYKMTTGPSMSITGPQHVFKEIQPSDTGHYYCFTSNEDGRNTSESVYINVTYGPRKPSVSVSPSSEIVEGSSVNLTCSSDANPPVDNYTWYKSGINPYKDIHVNTGPQHVFNHIKSNDTGKYYCKAYVGIKMNSTSIHIDVKYGPKNISVSVSYFGKILKGHSVTLTCSSNANPLVQNYTWYKDNITIKASGQSYNLTILGSEDSGEYLCEAKNEYGRLNSSLVFVNVLYNPKNTSVSVSPSGKVMEGSSVTLTCSSDANPPVNNYTWYKKNVTSPKASGQSYSITNIRSEDSGEYYCEAENMVGTHKSTFVMINVAGTQALVMTAAAGVTVVVLIVILCVSGLVCFRRSKSSQSTYDKRKTQDTANNLDNSPVYENVSSKTMTSTAAQTENTDNQEDLHYVSVHFSPSKNQEVPLYCTIQQSHPLKQEEETQYAAVKFNCPSAVPRPAACGAEEDPSVLYSTVNTPRINKT